MNNRIASFTWKYYQEILNKPLVRKRLEISHWLLNFFYKWIIKSWDYFCFWIYENTFSDFIKDTKSEDMYTEYIHNKTHLSDFFTKKPPLQTMVILWARIVDAIALEAQENFPDNDIVIFCMINKQRTNDVWISLYEFKGNWVPILEPYWDSYDRNSYYLKRTLKRPQE